MKHSRNIALGLMALFVVVANAMGADLSHMALGAMAFGMVGEVSVDMKAMIEAGLQAQGERLQKAIEKFEGQLAEKGKVDTETKGEVRELSEQYKQIAATLSELAQKQISLANVPPAILSAGQEFVASQAYKDFAASGGAMGHGRVRLEVKNTVTAVPGNTNFPEQKPGIIPGSFVPLTVRAALTSIPVTSNQVNTLRELAWTNSAAEVSQGAAKNESDLTFEAYDVGIKTIAHWIKISNQLLADAPAVVAYIDTRLRDGLAQRVDNQLINGNGTSPNISGLTDSGNYTAYTPTSDDNLVDAINRLKWTMWAAGEMADVVIVNPADWGTMERTRETSSGGLGQYLYGMPGFAAGMNPFGMRVVVTPYLAAGKIIMGSLNRSAMIYNRSGAVVEMGFVNDDFTKNLVTIRAEERLALACERPAGIRYGSFTTT